MRVLITAGAGRGGISTSLIVLAEGLIGRGHTVYCALWIDSTGKDDYLVARLESSGVQLHVEYLSGIPLSRRFIRRVSVVREIVRREKIDVVNPHYGGDVVAGPIVLGSHLAGRPAVASFHGGERAKKYSFAWFKDRVFGNLASYTTVINNRMHHEVLNRFPRRKNVVLIPPPGLPLAMNLLPEDVRAKYGIPASDFVLGTVSRIDANKRVGRSIEAFAQSKAFSNGGRFVLCGFGPLECETVELGQRLLGDKFVFLGRMDDPSEAYALMDAFILLSENEGLGNCFVEAARMGLPLIGTDVGGVPEIVVHEKSGILVGKDDFGGTVEAIDRLWADEGLRRKLGEGGREHSQRFSPESYIDAFEEILSQAKKRRPAGYATAGMALAFEAAHLMSLASNIA